ncbi:MAG: hypothetical protein B6I18_06215 [Bacteroidetes bacterium 4572_112]|nr:MAG: hypothetical protein B6I18_06215 [Bacteroidetes bacterium 4572_112]
MKYIILLLLSIFILSSCEKNANIEMPNQDPELVVAGFIAPNTDTLRLKLTWTIPIYNHTVGNDDLYENEANADVSFISNGNTINLKYDTIQRCYITTNANYNIGDVVDMSIRYNDRAELTATSIIPSEPLFDLKYLGIKTIDHGDYKEMRTEFDFKCLGIDPINYYRINMVSYSTQSGIYTIKDNMYMGDDEFLKMEPNTSATISTYYSEENILDSIRYYVINCSEEYYKYHISVKNYQGDDFFVEPSLIYDNVENGLGNFSSFNMVSDTLMVK